MHLLAERLVGHLGAPGANHLEKRVHAPDTGEVEERGKQFAPGEIPGGAEDGH
jgi:hypothetical protein